MLNRLSRASESAAAAPATAEHVGKLPFAVDATAVLSGAQVPVPTVHTPSKPRGPRSSRGGHAERLTSARPANDQAKTYTRVARERMARGECVRCGKEAAPRVLCPEHMAEQNARSRARIKAIQDAWFAGKTCALCGSTVDLQADHVDPTLKGACLRSAGAAVWHLPAHKREEELAKCRVLCRSCHINRHANERKAPEKPEIDRRYEKLVHHCGTCGERGHNARTCPAPRAQSTTETA